jgi:hypothetical protein
MSRVMTRWRQVPLQIYFTEDEIAQLRAHAEQHAPSLSAWARTVLLDASSSSTKPKNPARRRVLARKRKSR